MSSTCHRRRETGFTIMEMMIAIAVAGVIFALSLVATTNIHDTAGLSTVYWSYESRLQRALDDVSFYLLESRPSLVSFYTYERDGLEHTAIVFPTARNRSGTFVFQDEHGDVWATPLWQAIVVYAYADGIVRRYMDFSPRSYSSPFTVMDITDTEIVLSDGTRFNLNGVPKDNSQQVFPVLDQARRFVAEDTVPIHLVIEAALTIERPPAQTFIITLDTGILARNYN